MDQPAIKYRAYPGDTIAFEYVLTAEVHHCGGDTTWEELRKDTTRKQLLDKATRRINEFFESIQIMEGSDGKG